VCVCVITSTSQRYFDFIDKKVDLKKTGMSSNPDKEVEEAEQWAPGGSPGLASLWRWHGSYSLTATGLMTFWMAKGPMNVGVSMLDSTRRGRS